MDTGLYAGQATKIATTRIPNALERREPFFVSDLEATCSTILLPMRSQRGHDLGWVGLTLPNTADLPPPETIQSQVAALNMLD
jgi:ribose transport system ATP-binding protein/rhamnose transport system ATP-binding protein